MCLAKKLCCRVSSDIPHENTAPTADEGFMLKFDRTLREGLEKIIGIKLDDKWWRLAQLTPKFGGLSMRSGLTTYGAQHMVSLAKSAKEVERIVGEYDVLQLAKRETGTWLDRMCSDSINIEELVAKYQADSLDSEDAHPRSPIRYSIAQSSTSKEKLLL